MNSETDLTNFWLGWKATCAIRDCADKTKLVTKCNEKMVAGESVDVFSGVVADAENVVKLAKDVIKSTNAEFVSKLNYYSFGGKRTSVLGGEISAWKDDVGSAFELVESHLYAKQQIKGRPFKSYLFEDIGTRKGCLSQNLYGYVQLMIRSIVESSFGKESPIEEKEDDEGKKQEADVGSTEDRFAADTRSPELNHEVSEVRTFFGKYIDELVGQWDDDHLIALYAGLHQLPINNPEVAALCRRSKSALAEVSRKTLGNLLLSLRGRFSDRAIGGALEGEMQGVLVEKIRSKPYFSQLEEIWRKKYGRAGK